MIPAIRLYFLLAIALPIALLLAMLVNQQTSIAATLLFDTLIIGLAITDALRVKSDRVEVTRHPLHRLSIGRDNPVVLSVRSAKKTAKIQLRDSYPVEFDVSVPLLKTSLNPNTNQELNYTIRPQSRGEYQWGDIQVRQLGNWGLAWHDWKIPATEKVAVYPDLVMLKELSIQLTLQNSGTMRRLQKLGIGTEILNDNFFLPGYGLGFGVVQFTFLYAGMAAGMPTGLASLVQGSDIGWRPDSTAGMAWRWIGVGVV